ncbi:MAG: 3-hydroxyacyl-CoA dehydrogenase [Alkalilacustris sp.]
MSRPFDIGVVGTGTMGRGIAQLFALAGHRIVLHDARAGAAEEAQGFVAGMIARGAEKGRYPAAEAQSAIDRISVAPTLEGFADCGLVVEAIVEALEPKQALLSRLAGIVAPDAILATNTSSLSVTSIAAAVSGPERVAGLHFFNPVPLMRVVEVIAGLRTRPEVADRLVALVEASGHVPVRAADSPGFLVNHAGRGLSTEGLAILREGVATPAEIDRVMREAAGFRMGPFELFDLTGLDVSYAVSGEVYEKFWHDPRLRPTHTPANRVAAGVLGRKTGEGFYAYEGGHQRRPEPAAVPDGPLPPVVAADAALAAALGVPALGPADAAPADALVLVAPWGEDATACAVRLGLDARRVVAVDMLLGLEGHRTAMTTPVTLPGMRDAAHALLARGDHGVTVIHDSPGFVAQRILAMIVNIACEIAQMRLAHPQDIDRAVTLGLGYPQGPLALGDRLGPARLLEVLANMQRITGDPRYRPSPWLRRRAVLGASLLAPEG